MKKSDLELAFDAAWSLHAPNRWRGTYTDEYKFHPKRRWRFDKAFVREKVAVELEGGTWSGGRHVRGSGFEKDCEKYNSATVAGWRVLRYTASMLKARPFDVIQEIVGVLDGQPN